MLPDLRDGRPLGDGRREDLAEEREGDGVEALEEGPRIVPVAPLLVDRVLGRRVVPRQLCKDSIASANEAAEINVRRGRRGIGLIGAIGGRAEEGDKKAVSASEGGRERTSGK